MIAATNAPWDVDPALRRSGRFGKAIYIPEPDFSSRMAIIKMHAKKRPLARFIPYLRLSVATMGYASADLKALVDEAATIPWKEAFLAIEKKKQHYVAAGKTAEEAQQLAEAEVKQRPLNTLDFITALRKRPSSLPPWFEQAKKQIGKQEEITIVDGKEHKKVSDSKMGAGEKEAFKPLLKVIETRNQWWNEMFNKAVRETALIIPLPF